MQNKNIMIVIPAYKPDFRLRTLTEELFGAGYSVTVVDDGSGEEFKDVFSSLPKETDILTHAVNMGKGEALKTAFRHLTADKSISFVITADADGQHTPLDISRVAAECERLADKGELLVTGARKFDGKVPFKSRFGNSFTRFSFKLASGVSLFDTQTGLRGFPASMLQRLADIPGSRYEYELNQFLRLASDGIPIIELPIETVYIEGNKSSHFKAVRDSIRIYAGILRFCASSLISFGVDYILFLLIADLTLNFIETEEIRILAATVIARIISATVNYTLNRILVFRSKASVKHSLIKYALLAISILAGNYLLLYLFNIVLPIPLAVAKLLTEVLLFVLSYLVQRSYVFKSKIHDNKDKNP